MPGAQATARQRRRDRNGRCKPGVSRQGWKPARAETAPLAPFTTARPARGTPGKGISRRTTKQTIIRAAVIRVRTGGKRE
uniref:YubN n=1 Tax=Escherichia coli TaxID=562 RepID=A0A0F6X1F2_ECOLX|nr:YubN [Escherichia coli]